MSCIIVLQNVAIVKDRERPYETVSKGGHSAILLTSIKLPFVIKIRLFCLFSSGRLRRFYCTFDILRRKKDI